MISLRAGGIRPSATLAISALAAKLRAGGTDVVDLSAGQPDFRTPDPAKAAGKRAIDEDRTRYTANEGIEELRAAIAERLRCEQGLSYPAEQVLVSCGAKASLYFAMQALLNPGDAALVPSPYWVSYPAQVRLAGAETVFVPTREGFKLHPDDLREAITPATRLLLLNYPGNPTGACYSRTELEALARACLDAGLIVLADEIYGKLLYDGREFVSIAAVSPEMASRTVVIDGISKTYAMTGWRLGWSAGPAEIISAMARLQGHATSHPASITQWAALEALREPNDAIQRRRADLQQRRDRVWERLAGMRGIRCAKPEGSFYLFPDVSGLFADGAGLESGGDVARFLLEHAAVAVVPGEAFGSASHVRISYAAPLERLEEGLTRMERAFGELRG